MVETTRIKPKSKRKLEDYNENNSLYPLKTEKKNVTATGRSSNSMHIVEISREDFSYLQLAELYLYNSCDSNNEDVDHSTLL